MAVELATAYVSLTVSARGIKQEIEGEIGKPLERSARESGDKSGSAFSREFADGAKKGLSLAGVGLAAAMTKGFIDNLSIERGNDKLAAQLGLAGPAAAAAGKTAGDLYANAYGESLEQVREAVRATAAQVTGVGSIGSQEFEKITGSVLQLSKALEVGVGETAAAVGQLVKTGLAKDAKEATDLLAKGLQSGANRGGDLVDVLTRSSSNLKQFGLTGEQAIGIFNQALEAGAPSADAFTGALEELIGNAGDSADVFETLGLNGQQMGRALTGGGQQAGIALDVLLDRLRAIQDPAVRSTALVSLFGEEATALQGALLAVDPSVATDALGDFAGTADALSRTLNDNTATSLDRFRRTAETAFAGLSDKIGPVLSIAPALGGLAQTTDTVGPAMLRAAKGTAAFVKEVGLLKSGLVVGGVTAAIAATVQVFAALDKASRKADQTVEGLLSDLRPNDLSTYTANLAEVSAQLNELRGSQPVGFGLMLGGFREVVEGATPLKSTVSDYRLELEKLAKTEQELITAQGNLTSNVDYFGRLLGRTNDEVTQLANTAGVDLTKALNSGMVVALQKAQAGLTANTPKTDQLAQAHALLASKVSTASQKLDAFKSSLDATLGSTITAYDAATRLRGQVDDLAAAYAAAGGNANINAESGRALRDSLSGVVATMGDYLTALVESGAREADVNALTAEYIATLEGLQRRFPGVRGEIDGFIAKLRAIPPTVNTEVTVDTTRAKADIDAIKAALSGLTGNLGALNLGPAMPLPAGLPIVPAPVVPGRSSPRVAPATVAPDPTGAVMPRVATEGTGGVSLTVQAPPDAGIARQAELGARIAGWLLPRTGRR